MRILVVLGVVLAAIVAAAPSVAGRDATPDAAASTRTLLRLTLSDTPPDNVVAAGITRSTYAPGTGLRLVAGAGSAVVFVETGGITGRAVDAGQPLLVVPAGSASSPNPTGATPAAEERSLAAGDAFVLAAGSSADLRNDGPTPASTLTLIASPDATTEPATGVPSSVLAGGRLTLPSPPVEIALDLRTLAPNEFLAVPPPPAQVVVAAVDRTQAFHLGTAAVGYTNRDAEPMPVYVLTIGPAGSLDPGTPAA